MKKVISHPNGIFFDMDGVLLITPQRDEQSWSLTSQYFAPKLHLSPQSLEDALRHRRVLYRYELEQDTQKQRRDRLEPFETRTETVEKALIDVDRNEHGLAPQIVRWYETLRDEHRQLAPHAIDTLQTLRARGMPLALISNGNATYQRRKIAQHHLAPLFDLILIEEEFGVAKPDPRIFVAALNHFGLVARDVWMIGDDLRFDIAAAQHVGLWTLWCDYAHQGLPEHAPAHPDQIIYTLPEVVDLLNRADSRDKYH
jgi:putative hydrolase of the HAD superfamily